jgi:hypothetical protein
VTCAIPLVRAALASALQTFVVISWELCLVSQKTKSIVAPHQRRSLKIVKNRFGRRLFLSSQDDLPLQANRLTNLANMSGRGIGMANDGTGQALPTVTEPGSPQSRRLRCYKCTALRPARSCVGRVFRNITLQQAKVIPAP